MNYHFAYETLMNNHRLIDWDYYNYLLILHLREKLKNLEAQLFGYLNPVKCPLIYHFHLLNFLNY